MSGAHLVCAAHGLLRGLLRSSSSWPTVATVLVGLAAVFAIHPPPVGPLALVCFAVAAILTERWRAREGRTATVPAPI